MSGQSRDLEGLGALVTGGASGIGLATARLLAARGARVAVLDLAPDGLPRELTGFKADVSDDASRPASAPSEAAVPASMPGMVPYFAVCASIPSGLPSGRYAGRPSEVVHGSRRRLAMPRAGLAGVCAHVWHASVT